MAELDPPLPAWAIEAAQTTLGQPIVNVRRVRGREGGFGTAIRRVVELADGSTAFMKFGGTRRLRSDMRRERNMYEALDTPFLPLLLGYVEQPAGAALLLENHERAIWPPPWSAVQIHAVTDVLDVLRSTPPPPGLRSGPSAYADVTAGGWETVAVDPDAFLRRDVVAPTWLDRHIDLLIEMSPAACIEGKTLVHFDLRSDNVCFIDGSPRVVDWASVRLGHRFLDQHYWATTLHHETADRHEELLDDDAPSHFALLAGLYAHLASASPIDAAGVANARRAEGALRSLLPWMSDLLDIDPPGRLETQPG